MAKRARQKAQPAGPSIGVTIFAGLLIALFAALGTGPVLHLAARVLPTTESVVTVIDRSLTESTGYHPFRPVRLSDDRYSYFVTVRREDGSTRTIDAPRALYEAALPGLTTLSTVGLTETVLLRIPVAVSMESRFTNAGDGESYSLLIPLPGLIIAGIFAIGIAIYLTIRLLQRQPVHRPLLFGIIAMGAVLGGWWWL
ncbi:MAG: hypothetical protein KIS68_16145 [Bauldia sp.]|nr:hypothetical protein [Bauldia sp.]